jgi:hypothetical protein
LFIRDHTSCIIKTNKTANSVTGEPVEIKGIINIPLEIGSKTIMHGFNIVNDINFVGGALIGLDLLHKLNCKISFGDRNIVTLDKTDFQFSQNNKLKSFESIKTLINNVNLSEIPVFDVQLLKTTIIPANTNIALQAFVTSVNSSYTESDVIINDKLNTT